MKSMFSAGLILLTSSVFGAEVPATFKVGEFAFKRPEKWTWVETAPNGMRKAQLKVEAGGGQSAEVIFFHFGVSTGGGTKANVDRWLGMFQEKGEQLKSKVEEKTVQGHLITYVEASGTYLSGVPGGPKTPLAGHSLLGAIVEGGEGSVFIRLTGPAELAKSALPDFRKLAESRSAN